MTVQEIKDYAKSLAGVRDIPDAYVFMFINRLMDELAVKYDEAGKKLITIITAVENEWSSLPADCISVKRCYKNNTPVDEFIIENGQILFDTAGDYTVEYIGLQDRVTALTNIPEINILFHDALNYGVAYKESMRVFTHEDMIEGNNKSLLLKQFNEKSEEAAAKCRLMKKSRKRIRWTPFI